MIGDIVRVRYVCTLVNSDKIVTSTKNGMQLPCVEFVLGVGQVIKGFDRAIPQMSVGERSKITITGEYACKKYMSMMFLFFLDFRLILILV